MVARETSSVSAIAAAGLYDDAMARLIEGVDSAADLRWRELTAGNVAEALAHQVHAGHDPHDGH